VRGTSPGIARRRTFVRRLACGPEIRGHALELPVYTSLALCLPGNLIPEAVVVAAGGMVAGDDAGGMEEDSPKVVDAAHSWAILASVRVAAPARHSSATRSHPIA